MVSAVLQRVIVEEDYPCQNLLNEYRKTRDPNIRDLIVIANQNLVRFLAGKFNGKGEALEDLVQVGNIGLINAINRFDPERGIKFATYATPTITGEIKRHFRDKSWDVKVPRWLQELSLRINRATEKLTSQLKEPPTCSEVAKELGVSEEHVLKAMVASQAHRCVRLDAFLTRDDEEGKQTPLHLRDFLGEFDACLMRIDEYQELMFAIGCLDRREQLIIRLRFWEGKSQTEVAEKLNLSQMHISRLQQQALKRLRELLS